MKWGITGAGGQLGVELSLMLHTLGYPTQTWSRQDLNVTDESSVEVVMNSKPDVIVNCAAWTDVDGAETQEDRAFDVNQRGAALIAKAAKELQIPLIQISTDYVFSGIGSRPFGISDPTVPATAYGRSKLAGEREVLSIYPERSYILRTAWLYGQHGGNFPSTIIKKLLKSDEILKVVDDQFGQPTWTKDLASQIVELLENQVPFGIYHATNSGQASWFEFSQHILSLMNESSNRVVPISTSAYPGLAPRPSYSVLDHSQWSGTNISPMRNWKNAFNEAFPEILESVKAKINHG